MEYSKVAEGSPRREHRTSRTRNQRTMRTNFLESVAKIKSGSVVSNTEESDGGMRVKIVVKKQDLKQMLEAIRAARSNNIAAQSSVSPTPSLGLEQRLNLMRRRQQWRANQVKGSRRSCWRPALHSIPEEV
ncbi:hypothetical protein RHSIM_Rhsim11G0193900 [Rhododendron simsii]|uniref:Uncharacterized protein n=1 Tax=Rhododendron simsii TaxID=118357 RepID=A0A834G7Z5_RHOSS|nr:hypothetical protein RHSIM_Rhsim11G0193900 [Rhododendron simsii]